MQVLARVGFIRIIKSPVPNPKIQYRVVSIAWN